jgi:hypothetical protein
MDNTTLLSVGSVIVLLHILMNAHISKEIYQWVPSLQKRLVLFLCVWFIPFVGVAIAYKTLDLDWFKQKNKITSSGQGSVGGAFLEIDAIFNPSQKHVAEAKQKQVIEKKEDGEMHDKDKLDINKLKSTS